MGKESTYNAGHTGDADLIPGLGKPCGEGNGNPFQCSSLKNPMDTEWQVTVQRAAKRWT